MKSVWRITVAALLGALVGYRVVSRGAMLPDEYRHLNLDIEAQRVLIPALLLVAFSVYWGIASRNSAPTKNAESSISTIVHQTLLTVALLLVLVPVPGLNGWFIPPRFHAALAIGVVIESAAIALAVWARRHLGRNWAAEVRIGEGHELVQSGPYRRLRHPIYTGMLGIFTGAAIASSQYHAIVGVVLLFVAYIRKTRLEEDILRETFPAAYESYRRGTWRLVPLLY